MEAVQDVTYGKQWEAAIQEELASLEANGTWRLVSPAELPAGQRTIGCRWVFRIKNIPNSLIEQFTARLVARSSSQQYGVDYEETFAPSLRFDTLRILLAPSSYSRPRAATNGRRQFLLRRRFGRRAALYGSPRRVTRDKQ